MWRGASPRLSCGGPGAVADGSQHGGAFGVGQKRCPCRRLRELEIVLMLADAPRDKFAGLWHVAMRGVHRPEHCRLNESADCATAQLIEDGLDGSPLSTSGVNRGHLGEDARVSPRHWERLVRSRHRVVVASEEGERPDQRPAPGECLRVEGYGLACFTKGFLVQAHARE